MMMSTALLFLLLVATLAPVLAQQQLRGLAVNPQLPVKRNIKRSKPPTHLPTPGPTTAAPTKSPKSTTLPTRKRLRVKVFKASPPGATTEELEQYEAAPSLAANNDQAQRALKVGPKSKSKSPTASPSEATEGPTTASPSKATKAPKGSKAPSTAKATPPPKGGKRSKTASPSWPGLGALMRDLLHTSDPPPGGTQGLQASLLPDPTILSPERLPKKSPKAKTARPSRGPKRSPPPVADTQDKKYLRRHHTL